MYVDIRQGPLFLRLGKQQVVWGESDGLRLADIINPLDFSWHYFLEDWQDIRQGLPMARAIYGLADKTDLEFVWAPVTFKPAKWAGVGTYLGISGRGNRRHPREEIRHEHQQRIRRRENQDHPGFRDSTVSVYDYYHRFEMPTAELTPTGLDFAHPFVNSIGGTFNTFFDPLKTVFRGEAVYNSNEPHNDFTKPDFISKKDTIAFMLGADRPTYLPINSESSFLSFQVFYKQVLSPDDTTIMFGDSAAPGRRIPKR